MQMKMVVVVVTGLMRMSRRRMRMRKEIFERSCMFMSYVNNMHYDTCT